MAAKKSVHRNVEDDDEIDEEALRQAALQTIGVKPKFINVKNLIPIIPTGTQQPRVKLEPISPTLEDHIRTDLKKAVVDEEEEEEDDEEDDNDDYLEMNEGEEDLDRLLDIFEAEISGSRPIGTQKKSPPKKRKKKKPPDAEEVQLVDIRKRKSKTPPVVNIRESLSPAPVYSSRTPSPRYRSRSRSPRRYSRSPRRSPSYSRRYTPSPPRRYRSSRSLSPRYRRKRTPSPRRRSRSPVDRRSRSPVYRKRSPFRRSPSLRKSLSPVKSRPVRRKTSPPARKRLSPKRRSPIRKHKDLRRGGSQDKEKEVLKEPLNPVLEARKRKFESTTEVSTTDKKISLKSVKENIGEFENKPENPLEHRLLDDEEEDEEKEGRFKTTRSNGKNAQPMSFRQIREPFAASQPIGPLEPDKFESWRRDRKEDRLAKMRRDEAPVRLMDLEIKKRPDKVEQIEEKKEIPRISVKKDLFEPPKVSEAEKTEKDNVEVTSQKVTVSRPRKRRVLRQEEIIEDLDNDAEVVNATPAADLRAILAKKRKASMSLKMIKVHKLEPKPNRIVQTALQSIAQSSVIKALSHPKNKKSISTRQISVISSDAIENSQTMLSNIHNLEEDEDRLTITKKALKMQRNVEEDLDVGQKPRKIKLKRTIVTRIQGSYKRP